LKQNLHFYFETILQKIFLLSEVIKSDQVQQIDQRNWASQKCLFICASQNDH